MDELLIELNKLRKNQEESDKKILELITYNTKLPNDINKYFKWLKNQLEDLQDQVDRIEEIVDVKITSKQEMTRLKLRVRNLEDDLTLTKSKSLDIEDHLVSIEKSIFRNMTQCDLQYHDLLSMVDNVQKRILDTVQTPTNKKLQSDINNTKYTIKKLVLKQQENTITEKELKRLQDKQLLLEQLVSKS